MGLGHEGIWPVNIFTPTSQVVVMQIWDPESMQKVFVINSVASGLTTVCVAALISHIFI